MTREIIAEKGDIVLFKLDLSNWRSWLRPWAVLISFIQSNPTTHSAIVVEGKFLVICEAYYPRTRITLLGNVLEGCYTYDIVRPIGSTKEQRQKAAEEALSYTDTKYDWRSLFQVAKWFLLEKILGFKVRKIANIHEDEGRFFCQELVTQAYKNAGFNLAERLGFNDPSAMTPRDLDYAKGHFTLIDSSNPALNLDI